MKINLKTNNIEISVGDLIITKGEEMYLVVKDSKVNEGRYGNSKVYRLLELNSNSLLSISFDSLLSIKTYLSKNNIVKIIKSSNLELIENENCCATVYTSPVISRNLF